MAARRLLRNKLPGPQNLLQIQVGRTYLCPCLAEPAGIEPLTEEEGGVGIGIGGCGDALGGFEEAFANFGGLLGGGSAFALGSGVEVGRLEFMALPWICIVPSMRTRGQVWGRDINGEMRRSSPVEH